MTEVDQYAYLIKQITDHQHFLEETRKTGVVFEDAAGDWHRTIYTPLQAVIKRGNLIDSFPKRTIDDLYAYIFYHQWERGHEKSCGCRQYSDPHTRSFQDQRHEA